MLTQGEQLVFTMRTQMSCPVAMSKISPSTEYGFQKVTFRNESKKSIRAVNLELAFSNAESDSREEIVEGGRMVVLLQPEEEKRLDVRLGHTQTLQQRAKYLKHRITRVVL